MRKPLLAGLAGALVLGLSGTAIAQGPEDLGAVQTVEGSITPIRAGTTQRPRAVTLSVAVGATQPDGSQPPVVTRAVLQFPRELKFNGRSFATCTKSRLDAQKTPSACPRGSIVGRGRATGRLGATVVNFAVTAINAQRGRQILLFLRQTNGDITGTLVGSLSRSNQLSVVIPNELQQPAPGTYSSVASLTATIRATTRVRGRSVAFVQTTGCPASREWTITGEFFKLRGGSLTGSATTPCRR